MKVRVHFFHINVKFGMFTLHSCAYIPQRYLSGTCRCGLKKRLLFGGSKIRTKFGTANVYTVCKKWRFVKNKQLCKKYVLSTLFYKFNMIHNLNYKN